MVVSLHRKLFLVNGFLSGPIAMNCGIRQGCPLAPLLFIIALHVLCRIFERSAVSGIELATEEHSVTVGVRGYANNTSIHLNYGTQLGEVDKILNNFGRVSRLKVNAAKFIIIPLGRDARSSLPQSTPYTVLAPGKSCRYLDIQVGEEGATDEMWEQRIQSFNSSLALTKTKTHTAVQRALIARVVIMSKIFFASPFAWPLRCVQRLQAIIDYFVWGKRPGKW